MMSILQKKLVLMVLLGLILSGKNYVEATISDRAMTLENTMSVHFLRAMDSKLSLYKSIQWRFVFGGTSVDAVFFTLFTS